MWLARSPFCLACSGATWPPPTAIARRGVRARGDGGNRPPPVVLGGSNHWGRPKIDGYLDRLTGQNQGGLAGYGQLVADRV